MSEPKEAPRRGWRALRSDQLSGLMLIAFALFLGWENRSYPIGSLDNPGPGYMPLLIAIFLGVIGSLVVLGGSRSVPIREMNWHEAPRGIVIIVTCALAAFALEHLGYRLTVTALLVFFLGVIERRRALPVALVSLAFALVSFYIVGNLLLVPLPRSPWGF
jgi:hypothetical protein